MPYQHQGNTHQGGGWGDVFRAFIATISTEFTIPNEWKSFRSYKNMAYASYIFRLPENDFKCYNVFENQFNGNVKSLFLNGRDVKESIDWKFMLP